MLTVISETVVRSGREAQWDEAYHERAADARNQPGWWTCICWYRSMTSAVA